MNKRPLSDWASLAEIIASIAVVISLLFVGIQVRDNTAEVQSSQSNGLYEAIRDIDLTLLSNPYLMDAVNKGLNGRRSEMSDEEIFYFRFYLGQLFTVWEQAYFRANDGSISNEYYQGWEETFSVYLRGGVSPDDLDSVLSWFDEEFRSRVLDVAKSIED
jgi:hypothetical protein